MFVGLECCVPLDPCSEAAQAAKTVEPLPWIFTAAMTLGEIETKHKLIHTRLGFGFSNSPNFIMPPKGLCSNSLLLGHIDC